MAAGDDLDIYDRDGQPITMQEWGRLRDPEYKRVAATTLPDGRWVSTVWLGLDHNVVDDGPPLIFETMVFPSADDFASEDTWRYSTLAEAQAGHERVVASLGGAGT